MSVRKRKKVFVDFAIQSALLRRVLLHWVVFVTSTFVLLFCMHVMTGDPDLPWSAHLSAMWGRYKVIVFVLLSLMPAMMLDLNRWSHRFAGPMVRFRRSMRQLADGEAVGEMKFRCGDYWTDLVGDFNRVARRLRDVEDVASMNRPDAESPRHTPSPDGEPASMTSSGAGVAARQ